MHRLSWDGVGHSVANDPEDKLHRLCESLASWGDRKAASKRDLLSLIGHLQHAVKAVRQGRTFFRRLIDLAAMTRNLDSFVRLNLTARSDITWWRTFVRHWNGTSMLFTYNLRHPQVHVLSDASGSWGCAALTGKAWFQLKWPTDSDSGHISAKEMLPVVLAAMVWGKAWQGLSVCFHSDNSAVVTVLNSGSVRDGLLMHYMRCLHFVAAKYNFIFSSTHIRGLDNVLADALSRNKSDIFFSLFPQADARPTPIPKAMQEFLLLVRPDWTSPHCGILFSSFLSPFYTTVLQLSVVSLYCLLF